MKTEIYSAFPGTGKTTVFNKAEELNLFVLDSDSSMFEKSEFPGNYIAHIKENIGKVDIIMVSSHKEVREALVENELQFILFYPERHLKGEYIRRYIGRGSSEQFIDLLDKNWDTWIEECENQRHCGRVPLRRGMFIESYLAFKEWVKQNG